MALRPVGVEEDPVELPLGLEPGDPLLQPRRAEDGVAGGGVGEGEVELAEGRRLEPAPHAGPQTDVLDGSEEDGELGREPCGVVGVGVEAGARAELDEARGEPLVLSEGVHLPRRRTSALVTVAVAAEPLLRGSAAEAGEVAAAPERVELGLGLEEALVEVVGVEEVAARLAALAGLGEVARRVERGREAEPLGKADVHFGVEAPVHAPPLVVVADVGPLRGQGEGAFLVLHGQAGAEPERGPIRERGAGADVGGVVGEGGGRRAERVRGEVIAGRGVAVQEQPRPRSPAPAPHFSGSIARPERAGAEAERAAHALFRRGRDEVDDAGEGLAPVERRGRPPHHLDAVEAVHREAAEVERAGRPPDKGLAVEEDEGVVGGEALDLEAGAVVVEEGEAGGRRRGRRRGGSRPAAAWPRR